MLRYIYASIMFLAITAQDCDPNQVREVLKDTAGGGGLSREEVARGLKEALRVGTDTAVSKLHASGGYLKDEAVKILLPQEVSQQINTLNTKIDGAGPILKPTLRLAYDKSLKPLLEDMVVSLNRSAEDAAVKAKPIFVNAITGMTIQDAFGILKGPDTAATHYLKENTYVQLFNTFQPEIDASLSKPLVSGKSADDIYTAYTNTYNDIANVSRGLVEPISDVSLSRYVTTKGLDGLFQKVANEEENIREDPVARVTDLLQKVFGSVSQ